MFSYCSKYCESVKQSIGMPQLKENDEIVETGENNKSIIEEKNPKVIHMSKYRYLFEDSKLCDSKPHIPIII